ncbi:MAG: alpha/beta hydrolase [Ferruginibacter sp.]
MKLLVISLSLLLNTVAVFGYSNELPARDTSKPFVIGTIEKIYSNVLGEERILNIYLPDNYNPADTVKYPVIYLLDGSADEDFIHISGLVQFCSFEWVKQVPKSIVVGIANVDRRRDFTFPSTVAGDRSASPSSGHSDKFIQFLESELLPQVALKYKISASRTIIGESLGGLLATEILLKHTALFNKYIIVSPSLWWDNGSILTLNSGLYTASFNRPTDIYIGVGKEGLTPTTPPRVMEVDANILADKISAAKNKSLNTRFDYLPAENHGTIMHQAVLNAFRLFSKK